MKTILKSTLGIALLLTAASAPAQFAFNSATEALTVAEIQTAVGASDTTRIDGIALAPGGNLFVAHSDATESITFALIDLTTKNATWTKSEATVLSDLGLSGNLSLVGEMVYDPTNDRLVLASDIGWSAPGDPYTVFAIDGSASPYTASIILRDASIQGWNSHGVLSDGTIIGALGEEHEVITSNEPVVGFIDESGTPAFTAIFDADEFKTAAGLAPGDELPPETIGVDTSSNSIYIFGHDNFEFFSIPDYVNDTAPTHLVVPTWTDSVSLASRVDLHGISVDGDGNVYGFDEATESIVIWNGSLASSENFAVAFDDIQIALSGANPVEVTVWRGMKVRKVAADQYEVFLASASNTYGVIRVLIDGNAVSSVDGWDRY